MMIYETNSSAMRAIESEKGTLQALQATQDELARYKGILLDALGPLQCPQSWRNLIEENNRLKEQLQLLSALRVLSPAGKLLFCHLNMFKTLK